MNSTWFLELATSLFVQAAVVILATFVLTRFVRDSRFVGQVWSASYVVLLGLVFAAVLLPHPRWIPRFGGELSRPAASELLTLQIALGRALFVVWLVGALALWVWMLAQSARVTRFLKTCREVPADHPALAECRDDLNLSIGEPEGVSPRTSPDETVRGLTPSGSPGRFAVRVLSSAAIAGPFCWQFHRPHIVLPEFLLGLAPRELRFIVRHELAHLRTGHPLQLFLQRVVEVLFWFHPLVWWAARQVSRSREFACDDAAIDQPAQVADYLRTLLIVVEHSAVESERSSPVLAFGRNSGIVAERARRLAEIARFGWPSPSSRRRFVTGGLAWIAIVSCCFGLWLPVDVVASPRSTWSPWPHWSANVLREFGITARDFEVYDARIELHEMLEDAASRARPAAQDSNSGEPEGVSPRTERQTKSSGG